MAAVLSIDPAQKQGIILGDLVSRVIQPWGVLQGVLPPTPPPAPPPAGTNTGYPSLYVLLDLADWLKTNLPAVYGALIGQTALPNGSAAADLLSGLKGIQVGTQAAPPVQPPPPGWTSGTPAPTPLPQALQQLTNYASLVTGGSIAAPLGSSYDLGQSGSVAPLPANWLADSAVSGGLSGLALAALKEANVQPTVPPELSGMIKADPAEPVAGYAPDTYVIRTVFEHDPCVPVLSAQSRPFQLARVMDGDAPARKIRIALPDISNLRQFQRGVAIETPPSLRRVLDRVNPGLLQGRAWRRSQRRTGDDLLLLHPDHVGAVVHRDVPVRDLLQHHLLVARVHQDLLPHPRALPGQERTPAAMTANDLLYGQGLSFPPRVGPDGSMLWSIGEINVRECICTILRTSPGERVEMPTFGCGLRRFLFEPNTARHPAAHPAGGGPVTRHMGTAHRHQRRDRVPQQQRPARR